jgi:hypothetical protein
MTVVDGSLFGLPYPQPQPFVQGQQVAYSRAVFKPSGLWLGVGLGVLA